jgi:hypothetical protein
MTTAILDGDSAAFIQTGVSIVAASRDASHVPSIARVSGCRVSADRRAVTIFAPRSQAAQLLADLESAGRIAVVFSRPSTHRTLQLKGDDARVRAATTAEAAYVETYVEAFAREVATLGHTSEQARTLLTIRPDDLCAIDFTPNAAFEQTPGPKAGSPLAAPR